jgi:hypothetical protein
MNPYLQTLSYLLPTLVALGITYYLVKTFLEHEENKRVLDLRYEMQKTILPIRIQAYERLILLLERMQPTNLLIRVNLPGMTATDLQSALIKNVRDEFDHNLSQQLYISSQAWEMVKSAKEESIKLINSASSGLDQEATATDLGTALLSLSLEIEKLPVQKAMDLLKKEAREIFF